jgi:hypothetical protein
LSTMYLSFVFCIRVDNVDTCDKNLAKVVTRINVVPDKMKLNSSYLLKEAPIWAPNRARIMYSDAILQSSQRNSVKSIHTRWIKRLRLRRIYSQGQSIEERLWRSAAESGIGSQRAEIVGPSTSTCILFGGT